MSFEQPQVFVLSLKFKDGKLTDISSDGPHSLDSDLTSTLHILEGVHKTCFREYDSVQLVKLTYEPSQYQYHWPRFEILKSYVITDKERLSGIEQAKALFGI